VGNSPKNVIFLSLENIWPEKCCNDKENNALMSSGCAVVKTVVAFSGPAMMLFS
jgi:hypothetical protein